MLKDKDLLASVSDTSTDSEFFSPMPDGYKKGKTRYVFVIGHGDKRLGKRDILIVPCQVNAG